MIKQCIRKPIGGLLPLNQWWQFAEANTGRVERSLLHLPTGCYRNYLQVWHVSCMSLLKWFRLCAIHSRTLKALANNVFRRAQKYLTVGDCLVSLEFADSRDIPGLQVADFIAYECLQLRRNLHDPVKIAHELRWTTAFFVDKFFPEFEFYTAQKLKERYPLPIL